MGQTIEKIFEVYNKNVDKLKRLAISITGDYLLAEDALQDLAILILTNESSFSNAMSPVGYLLQVLRNHAIALSNENKKHSAIHYPLEAIASESSSNDYLALEDRELLDAIFKDVSPEFKQAFYRHYIEGYSIEELAKEMGTTANALSLRFSRLRKKATSFALLLLILKLLLE